MAKIGVVGDIHWSKYSSILRSRGDKYSYRLENCIESINWAEQVTKFCNEVVYLGDFFDTSELSAEEITALNQISWNNVPHHFIVGNHEMGMHDLSFSSSHVFNMVPFATVYNKPVSIENQYCGVQLCFLPYILEEERKSFEEYMTPTTLKRIVFSHNDIKDFQMGAFLSKTGFSIEEIQNNCDMYLNGHLHNGDKVADKIFNVGNLTGQNFSEDASRYDHVIFIIDTDTMGIDVYENPYAVNFYKIDYGAGESLSDINKNRCAVTVRVPEKLYGEVKKQIEEDTRLVASRLLIIPDSSNNIESEVDNVSLTMDHLEEFKKFVLEKLGNSDIVNEELGEVVNG